MKWNDTKDDSANRTDNYEGGEAYSPESPELGLYKVTMNNLLEGSYYEEDEDELRSVVRAFNTCVEENEDFPLKLAYYARNEMGLRDVSILLLVLASKHVAYTGDDYSGHHEDTRIRDWTAGTLYRMDDAATALAMSDEVFGSSSEGLKKGIADFIAEEADDYLLGKYKLTNRDVNMYDVINRTHPHPGDKEKLFERFMLGNLDEYPNIDPLDPPETWEVKISERGNNRKAWQSVLDRMPLFAKIRNVRNMLEAGVDGKEIFGDEDMDHVRNSMLYPFRFYQSYKAVKSAMINANNDMYVEQWLSDAIDVSSENISDSMGDTLVGVDLSGSMSALLSYKSSMSYKEIAQLFGASLMSKGADVGGFGDDFKMVTAHYDTPTLQRMEAIKSIDSEVGNSTNGWKAIRHARENNLEYSRFILLTDMQIWDTTKGRLLGVEEHETVKSQFDAYRQEVNNDAVLYMIDLGSYGDLVTPEGYNNVYNISGWSEEVLDFIEYAEDTNEIIEDVKSIELQ